MLHPLCFNRLPLQFFAAIPFLCCSSPRGFCLCRFSYLLVSFSFSSIIVFFICFLSSQFFNSKNAYFLRAFYPVLGVTVNADPFVASDEFDYLDTPLDNELAGSSANVQPVELSHHSQEELWRNVKQIVDPTSPLLGIPSSRVKILFTLTRTHYLDYRDEAPTATWSAECNPSHILIEDAGAERGGGGS